MFQIGDNVICGMNGVCKVTEIGTLDMLGANNKKEYYTLQPIYSKESTVYIPVENKKLVIRNVLTKDEAQKLIENISGVEVLWTEDKKIREKLHKESMRKFDSYEWIKIVKTLYIKKEETAAEGKKITSTDDKYFYDAGNYLYGELSISLNIPREEAEALVINKLKEAV